MKRTTRSSKLCNVAGCTNVQIARGWCHKHYKRWQVHGDVTKGDKYKSKGVSMVLYQRWRTMLKRCYNPNAHGYSSYGGRGITVCDEWRRSYVAFLNDVGLPPTKNHTLDRIDNDGNYEPSNVRWATRKEQANNTRQVLQIEHKGEIMSLTMWCERLGINRSTAYSRLKSGYPIEYVLSARKNTQYIRKKAQRSGDDVIQTA